MPALVLAFAAMLTDICASLVGRIILAVGLEFVTYKGLDVAFSSLESAVIANLNSLPGTTLALFSAAGIFKGISIIFGAITARITISGIRNGSFTRILAK